MEHLDSPRPVVVGIDGSKAAIAAALWAVDEAISRDVPLRLVHVEARADNNDDAMGQARQVLDRASTAVEAIGKTVKLESDILAGDPAKVLVDASRSAEIVCVGWKGVHDSGRPRGRTAAQIARSAVSPVAIVRRRHTTQEVPPGTWVLAVLDETPSSHGILQTALDQAQLRNGAVLALTSWSTTTDQPRSEDDSGLRAILDRCVDDAQHHTADVQVCAIPMPNNMLNLLTQSASIDQLVVVGRAHHDLVEELLGPKARHILRASNCSLLIDREAETLQ